MPSHDCGVIRTRMFNARSHTGVKLVCMNYEQSAHFVMKKLYPAQIWAIKINTCSQLAFVLNQATEILYSA